jgi:hypothetical protein
MCGVSEKASVARKTLVLDAPVTPVRSGTYRDYPDCLPRLKWLIEEGLRIPERIFNSPTLGARDMNAHYCKACGAAYRKVDFAAHVNEHAAQLNLPGRVAITKRGEIVRTEVVVEKVSEELKLTIIDSLSERIKETQIQFNLNYGLLGDKVARAINDMSKDGGASKPPMCEECQ